MLLCISKNDPSRITVASAGHEPLLLYRSKTKNSVKDEESGVKCIAAQGMILGIMNDIKDEIKEREIQVNKGDKILLYTDGAIDARKSGQEFFSQIRLMNAFSLHAHLPIADVVERVYQEIRAFSSDTNFEDDITLVGIEKTQ